VYPVKTMCRVLEVSRSGYYAWRRRDPSARAVANARLLERIEEIHEESDGTYGAQRIHAELESEGHGASRNRVARVMREAGIEGVSRRKRKRTTVRAEEARPAPDLVERDFSATGPDQLWVADITYVPTWAGFLYLAIVLDAWSRRVVGWAMETHLRTELVLEALEMAVWRRKPAGVIHHSDQGSQYTSVAFGGRCEEMGVRPTMGSVGDAYDNAMAESFFASLECELIDRRSFRTQAEARMGIFCYIEGWYNPRRRHSALNYESPVSFEGKYGLGGVRLSESSFSPWSVPDVHPPQKTTREDAPGSTIAASPYLRVYPPFPARTRPVPRVPPAPCPGRFQSTPLRLRRSGSS
jgi:putative transposase